MKTEYYPIYTFLPFSPIEYNTLLEQKSDLVSAIDDLLQDLAEGRRRMKLYRQMKMYNDPQLNPMLYGKK